MGGVWPVAAAVVRRNLTHAFKNPALLLPSLIFPLFFLVAFAGGLSSIGNVPGFNYAPGYTTFQFVFVLLQSAAFGGVFTGFAIAADFESGFARRLMLGAPHRGGLVLGWVVAAEVRLAFTGLVVTVAGLVAGIRVLGTGVDVFGLVGLAILINAAAALWGAGVAMRARTLQAGALIQIPVFVLLFLAPVYVPLDLLQGWIHAVATVNPATFLLEAGRGFLAGERTRVAAAVLSVLGLLVVLTVWAVTGLRRAEREA